ncbi:MAG: glycosyltransferase [Candidatus Pacebacteria bacterium]|nr:glycosyltransferase [Candidatus Paceibacterota bacterium]
MPDNLKDFLITVCITHFKDTDFVLNILYCLKKLTKNNYRVIIRDNNSPNHFFKKLKAGIQDYDNIFLYRAEDFNLTGSLAHGTALNDLVSRINTPYGVIMDADYVFLIKDWDEILKSRLNGKVKIIGTETPLQTMKGFPFLYGLFFETETFKKLNIDLRPGNVLKGQDTGWRLKDNFLQAGYQGELLFAKNTRVYQQGPFAGILGVEEYYLNGNNHIFGCHFGRGSTLGSAKYKKGCSFIFKIPFISRPLRKMRGKKESKKWIDICHKIVDAR